MSYWLTTGTADDSEKITGSIPPKEARASASWRERCPIPLPLVVASTTVGGPVRIAGVAVLVVVRSPKALTARTGSSRLTQAELAAGARSTYGRLGRVPALWAELG